MIQDSPLTLPGKRVEVEGVELEPEERSMKGWCQVRRKNGQGEKAAATETRSWEEFKGKFPYLAHYWRRGEWREVVKEWSMERLEEGRIEDSKRLVAKSAMWRSGFVRVGRGGDRGGDVL